MIELKRFKSENGSIYDPHYDPLTRLNPGKGQGYAPTYWADTAGQSPEDDGVLREQIESDVVIVGAGFTGLATAIYLAREHGIVATILEANRVGWGCTSRNGGQALYTTGRLSRSQWIQRWGKTVALDMHEEIEKAYQSFFELVNSYNIQCDMQEQGHLSIAHREHTFKSLLQEAKVLRSIFSYQVEIIDRATVHNNYVGDKEAVGAILEPKGNGIHPLKLAYSYLRVARSLGVRIFTGSPVISIRSSDGIHYVYTPDGCVRASSLGLTTGGYTSPKLHPTLLNRSYPILSNSIVTRPLSIDELEATNFNTSRVITDTRTLRYYYRKLPDRRIQIGTRGAITGADASNPRHYQSLLHGFHRKFPALNSIGIDYSWWGWVDVSHDMMPRVYRCPEYRNICYALGYGGSGVMYSARAGQHLAGLLMGKVPPKLPLFESPLPGTSFAPFRRLGQRALYRWYKMRDERY